MNPAGKPFQVNYLCHQPLWLKSKRNGKYWCNSCSKNIPDLREADAETIRRHAQEDGDETCGIFYPDLFEENIHTRKGPALAKIILTGAIAGFAGMKQANAQTIADTVKTEQHIAQPSTGDSTKTSVQSPAKESFGESLENWFSPRKIGKARKKINLFWIGSRQFYLNSKPPFIHSRVVWMGKFKY